jgi:tetratricopeptide (TPR) repeat protein
VAAQSLLAVAYVSDGQWYRYEMLVRDSIDKLTAVTSEDYLFRGYALSTWGPAAGLRDLNEAIRRRDSTIARVLRASARAYVALETGDVKMAQSAIDDASTAKNMMPGNPFAAGTELRVHLVAMVVFRDAGERDQATASLLQAARDAQELEQLPALPMSYVSRWSYFQLAGQEEAAHEVARKGYQEADAASTRLVYVYSLYEQGDFEKAREVFERVGGSGEVSGRDAKSASGIYEYRPFILAELPDGPSRALEAYRENCALFPKGYLAILNQATLLFLGRKTEATAASRELTSRHRGHELRILEYCAGILSEQEYLNAGAGSRNEQCVDHFFVALDRLAQADRAGAREHFRKDLATGVFRWSEYQWSRLFLKRMEKDPNWPPWIPLQEPATQPTTTP